MKDIWQIQTQEIQSLNWNFINRYKVKAAANGTEIKPEFNIWIDGNPDSDIKTVVSDPIIVSAAPKYNFSVVGDSGVDYLGYFNKETGEISSEKKDGFERGRLARYALNFQIYNDSAAKGLKGIELPSGNANFDIALNAELDGVSINDSDDYSISMWDYSENESGGRGHLGRVITPGNSTDQHIMDRIIKIKTGLITAVTTVEVLT